MVHRTILWVLLLTFVLVTSTAAETQTYVSFKGGFYITYPDDWVQIDYSLVDAYLLRNRAGETTLDYDAAFAMKDSPSLFAGNYLILVVDTVGQLSDGQIDSVLNGLSRSFGEEVKYYPVADFLTDLKSNTPSYDAEAKTVTILNEITEQQQLLKKNLLMMKFYDRGIATFYFYSPDSLFEASKPLFDQIVASLSTENVEDALPKEELKVADLEDAESGDEDENDKSKKIYLYIGAALVLVIVILIRRLK